MQSNEAGYWLSRASEESKRRVRQNATMADDYWTAWNFPMGAVRAAASVACEVQMITESFPETPDMAFRG